MAKRVFQASSTSKTIDVFIQDNSVTTGAGLTGVAYNTSGLAAYYYRDGDSSWTAISLATATLGTWSSGGFIVGDGTHAPGMYQLGLPNAALTVLGTVKVYLQGVTNMAPCIAEVQVVAYNPEDAVHLGLSSLPNTACTTNASLITSGTGTDQLSVSGGRGKADVSYWSGTVVSSPTTAGIPEVNVKNINNVSASSVTTINAVLGQAHTLTVDSSGNGNSNLVNIAGSAVSTTTAQLGVNVVKINAVSTSSVTEIDAYLGTTQKPVYDGNNLLQVDLVDIAGSAVSATTAQLGVNVVNWNSTAVTKDANNAPNVSAKYWAGTAITATSIPVTATAGASGGLFIAGANDHLTITNNLQVGGTTTLIGAVTASSNLAVTSNFSVGGTTTFTGAISGTSSGNDLRINGAVPGASGGLFLAGTNDHCTITNALLVSGTTTFTGAITGSNASNNLRINGVVPGASGGLFIAGTNAATTVTGSLTTTFTGDLTGNVDGNVSGNIAGTLTTYDDGAGALLCDVAGYQTGQDPATLVLGATASDWDVAGTIGAAINASGGSGDPWATDVPGSYSGSQAGYVLGNIATGTPPTALAIAQAVWEDTTAGGDFGTAGSIGKLIVTTGLSIAGIKGTITTLDALSSHGDSSWATATGFATPTNITAGTITTVTNLTNAPTSGDFTATMKTSLGTAVGTPQTGDAYAIVNSGTFGNSALHTQIAAVQTHGDSTWATATGFALASNWTSTRAGYIDNLSGGAVALESELVMVYSLVAGLGTPQQAGQAVTLPAIPSNWITTAGIANGAITDAKFTVPSLNGPAAGILGMIAQVWRRFFKHTVYDGNAETIKTYADDGTTVVTTQDVTVTGNVEDVGAAS